MHITCYFCILNTKYQHHGWRWIVPLKLCTPDHGILILPYTMVQLKCHCSIIYAAEQEDYGKRSGLSDSGTVLRWFSSHASFCLPRAISALIHTVCPIVPPPRNFSSLPPLSSHPPSPLIPLFFPLWSPGGLCERPGRRAEKKTRGVWKRREMLWGHHWVIIFPGKAGCMVRVCVCVCVCVCSVAFLKLCAYVWVGGEVCTFQCAQVYLCVWARVCF